MKPNVCQRLVEQASQGANVVDSDRAEVLEQVDEWAQEHFVLIDE